MKNLIEMRKSRDEMVKGVREFLNKIEQEGRAMTPEETQEYDRRMAEVEKSDDAFRREEDLQRHELKLEQKEEVDDREKKYGEFRSLTEMVCAIRFNPSDPRLAKRYNGEEEDPHYQYEGGQRTPVANMDHSDQQGGYLVPDRFIEELLKVDPESAIFRPRARVLPAGFPPDGQVELPVLDQGQFGILGGVQVAWIDEGELKPASKPYVRLKTLKPNECAGRIVVTDKLLRNTRVWDPLARDLLRSAIIEFEEAAFLNGTGVGQPTGLIGHASVIQVPRAVAGSITYADITNMYAQKLMGGSYVWIAHQGCTPALMTIQDPAGHYIWQPNAREGAPGTMLGYPVVMTTRNPVLGTAGDLLLVDLKYYLIKDGSGPFVDALSSGDYYDHNKTVIKITWNVDGNPWPNSPFDFNGYDVSPFLQLDDYES